MAETTVNTLLDAALQQHQAGNFDRAGELYRRVLEADPRHADALHLLGVLAYQVNRPEVAARLIESAIAIKPAAAFFGNYGLVLGALGRWSEAVFAYRRAIEIRPDFPEAYNNLGTALRSAANGAGAVGAYQKAIALRPDFAEAHNNLGLALGDLEQFDDAIASFRRAIAIQPRDAQARNNLGNAFFRRGDLQTAIACWREAISLDPNLAEAHNNLGNALKNLGGNDEAIASLNRALAISPNFPEAHNNLGVIQNSLKKFDAAIASFRKALSGRPDYAEAYYNLAIALHGAGQLGAAIDACRQAIVLRSSWSQASNNLGVWLAESGRPMEAMSAFEAALTANPDYPEAHGNRGNVLRQMGRLVEAETSYRRAVALEPSSAEAFNNLGQTLRQSGRFEDAIAAFHHAIAIEPDLPEPHNNLGNVFKDQGALDEAIACYDRALAINPKDAEASSNRIYTLYFHPRYDAAAILREHQQWNATYGSALNDRAQFGASHFAGSAPRAVHSVHCEAVRGADPTLIAEGDLVPRRSIVATPPTAGRRLRIGYVSPDFRDHCQAFFTLPLLANHDRERFEIVCYSDVAAPDAITQRIRNHADLWRPIAGMTDAQAADAIRADEVDLLIDLTVHMSHNRMLTFARKPAPIQATWLGYPGTTGLETMDYRLSDPYLDPPAASGVERAEYDGFYSETTIRLPDTFWCYDPLTNDPSETKMPADRNGHITFGCLNNFCKTNEATLRLWAQVMSRTPKSRLILLAPEGAARNRVLRIMSNAGIGPSRIAFVGRQSRRRYLETFHQIDLSLDTFPYNGHTTSLDGFWMGVATVTRVGQTAVSRGGWSQLSNLGLTEFAARSDEGFVETAVARAGDIHRLRDLRRTLRDRLLNSPLMNAPLFARNMEAAFGQMIAAAPPANKNAAAEPKLEMSLFTPAKNRSNGEVRQAS